MNISDHSQQRCEYTSRKCHNQRGQLVLVSSPPACEEPPVPRSGDQALKATSSKVPTIDKDRHCDYPELMSLWYHEYPKNSFCVYVQSNSKEKNKWQILRRFYNNTKTRTFVIINESPETRTCLNLNPVLEEFIYHL